MPDYFTLDEFRELPDVEESDYSDELIERAAAYIVAVIERAVGISFVPRTYTKTWPVVNGAAVATTPYLLEVTSSAVNDLTGYATVTYTAGYSETPPADIKEAALQGTRARLLDTASNAKVNDRTSSMTNEVGGTTTYVLPGVDRPTGYPEVDAVILGWRKRLFGLGFV